MERNFKKEIQEAASNPIDMAEMMAQLVQVLQSIDENTLRTDTSRYTQEHEMLTFTRQAAWRASYTFRFVLCMIPCRLRQL